MKHNILNKLIALITCCFTVVCPQCLFAQAQHIDTNFVNVISSIVRLQSVYASKESPAKSDTLIGTAFMLADGDKLYLVTAKHLIQADLHGKNQHQANDSISLRYYVSGVKAGAPDMKISGLSVYESPLNSNVLAKRLSSRNIRAVMLSNDEDDIAVISLQKAAYKSIANYLLAQGTPISINLIDSRNQQSGQTVWRYGVTDFMVSPKDGTPPYRLAVKASTSFQIDRNEPSATSFTISSKRGLIDPGNDGSAIVANGKLVGMLSAATGTSIDQNMFKNSRPAMRGGRVIKAELIVNYLRQLQQYESDPDFNK